MQVPFTRSHFQHPLATHSALDVLGYRRNGAPIYAIAGGNGEGEGGSESGGQSGSGESGQSGQGGSEGGGTAAGQGGQQSGQESGESGSGKEEDWKAHARKWEERAKENKAEAEKGKAAAAELEKLRKERLTDQEKAVEEAEKAGRTAAEQESAKVIETKDATIRDLTAQLAVYGRAEKQGVKVAPLLNSRSFYEALGKLDPSSSGFGGKVDDLIKAELKANPGIATQTAGKSGGDLSGGTGEGAAKKRTGSLAGAIANAYQT
ncbi:hypothetical protein G9272_32105 [Streptomyces asoensis]|uniref:Scaffolding protein n=1 Tax=Streptomyces asoensis TaxID=249586 RepID=A0A6M4WWN9_9ACTN|nr:hypothetical protein [Streptomyces asoensis]QJT04362.1 hypothetical protein G9272_32105 [Streptomyces asoensis]